MPANDSNVMSSDSEDEVSDGMGDTVTTVRQSHIAAVFPSRAVSNGEKLKAPLHVEHLFWRCAVAGASSDKELVPVFETLIDHGAHAVLIRESVVNELNLKRRKLPCPEEVEGAMTNPGDSGKTTTLTEYVKLKLYCPVSGWAARTVRAIIAPLLCAPIILGLPWIGFNDILVDVSLRTAICKTDGVDILHPIPRITKTVSGGMKSESQLRREARADKAETEQKERLMHLIWHSTDSDTLTESGSIFWDASTIRTNDGSEVRIRAAIDKNCAANLINPDTTAHLHLKHAKLDRPVLHKYCVNGEDKVASITEYVTLKLLSACFKYTSMDVIALVLPDINIMTAQMCLGAPFVSGNKLVLEDSL